MGRLPRLRQVLRAGSICAMPVKRVTDTNEQPETSQDATDAIRKALVSHHASVRWLRAQRKKGPRRRTPPLATKIAFEVAAAEELDDICAEAASAIMDVILADADGEQWNGDVDLLGEDTRFGKAKVIASVDVSIEGEIVPSAASVKSRAEADAMTSLAKTVDGLGTALVKLANAKASDAEAMSKIVAAFGESMGRDRKYEYKIAKEHEETEREDIKERAATTRAKVRWNAFETLVEEGMDVAEIWSKWLTQGRKPGEPMPDPPKPPTKEECDRVFKDPRLETPVTLPDGASANVHTLVREMIGEGNIKRRFLLARTLLKVLNGLPKDVADLLKVTMAVELGEKRAVEVAAWLSGPITQP